MGEKTGEYIFEIVKDSDGVYCYIKHGEIVRCKDCKYWDNTTKWSVCTKWSVDPYEQANTEKNDFCSYGERADT